MQQASDESLPAGVEQMRRVAFDLGTLNTRVTELERKASNCPFYAAMYVQNSGTPTHTSSGAFQKVGSGGGTTTWVSSYDVSPPGFAAQVDTTTNKRLDVVKTGLYEVQAFVFFTQIASTFAYGAQIVVNGSEIQRDIRAPGATVGAVSHVSVPVYLAQGDYVELFAFQNETANEGYNVSNAYFNRLAISWIGAL